MRHPQLQTERSVLEEKLLHKTAKIGIVGLGYVGLPLAIEFARAGFHVIGIDVQESRVKHLKGAHVVRL